MDAAMDLPHTRSRGGQLGNSTASESCCHGITAYGIMGFRGSIGCLTRDASARSSGTAWCVHALVCLSMPFNTQQYYTRFLAAQVTVQEASGVVSCAHGTWPLRGAGGVDCRASPRHLKPASSSGARCADPSSSCFSAYCSCVLCRTRGEMGRRWRAAQLRPSSRCGILIRP